MVTTSNIYVIENVINNKKYVGQTINPSERWYRHTIDYKRLTNKHLYRAMNKYGIDNFTFKVIESNISIKDIHNREVYWIEQLKTFAPNGYNMTIGGEGTFNREVTIQTREKISKKLKGNKASEETKIKQSKVHSKRYLNEEERIKMSESHKNNEKLIENATNRIIAYNESLTEDEIALRNEKKAIAVREKLGKKVEGINIFDGSIVNFDSARQASRWIRENTEFPKASHTNISKACRGKLDYIYNYKWKYV